MINRWSYVSTLEAMSRYQTVYQSNYSPFSRTVFCSETSSSGLSLGRVGVNKLRRWMMSARNSAPMSNRGHVSAYMQFWKKERTVVKMCCPTWQWQHFPLIFIILWWIFGGSKGFTLAWWYGLACILILLAKRKYVWYTVLIVTMPTIPPRAWSWQLIAESEPLRILSQNRERSGSIDYSART